MVRDLTDEALNSHIADLQRDHRKAVCGLDTAGAEVVRRRIIIAWAELKRREDKGNRRDFMTRLLDHYSPPAAVEWMTVPHPQLNGSTPIAVWAHGRGDEVHAILDRLDGDAYI